MGSRLRISFRMQIVACAMATLSALNVTAVASTKKLALNVTDLGIVFIAKTGASYVPGAAY